MELSIQQRIDANQDGFLELPPGEYEGPFVIRHPCKLYGNATVLWAKKGPVITIEAPRTTLKDIRIESLENTEISILSKRKDTYLENVEVSGKVCGIALEEGRWDLPRTLSLGELYAQKECVFMIEVYVPTQTVVKSLIEDITVFPEKLEKGKNKLTIKTGSLRDGVFLYGDVLFCSQTIHRCYISGAVKQTPAGYIPNRLLYVCKDLPEEKKLSPKETEIERFPPVKWNPSALVLQKGQRVPCDMPEVIIEMAMEEKKRAIEIDPYVFLLNTKNKAEKEEDMIFFGNVTSLDGSVKILEETTPAKVAISLEKVSPTIERISIAYGIYEENTSFHFSDIKGFTIKVKDTLEEKMVFQPQDLQMETTVIALEFYRYKGKWKVSAIGAGYHNGLRRLCESYGLEVEN